MYEPKEWTSKHHRFFSLWFILWLVFSAFITLAAVGIAAWASIKLVNWLVTT